MVSYQSIEDMITSGISKSALAIKEKPNQVQICFKMSSEGTVLFFVCIDEIPKHSVDLNFLIGKHIYNSMVKTHLARLLNKFSHTDQIEKMSVNLMCGLLQPQPGIYVHLMDEKKLVRKITNPDELKK